MNGESYTRVLAEGYLPFLRAYGVHPKHVYILEDNDSKHTSKVAKTWKK